MEGATTPRRFRRGKSVVPMRPRRSHDPAPEKTAPSLPLRIRRPTPIIQKYQYERRSTMLYQILALKICGIRVPQYNLHELKKFRKFTDFRTCLRIFWGTLKRVYKGRYS